MERATLVGYPNRIELMTRPEISPVHDPLMLLPFEQEVSGRVLVLFPEFDAVEGVVGRTFFFPGFPWVISFVLSFDIFFFESLLNWIKDLLLKSKKVERGIG